MHKRESIIFRNKIFDKIFILAKYSQTILKIFRFPEDNFFVIKRIVMDRTVIAATPITFSRNFFLSPIKKQQISQR